VLMPDRRELARMVAHLAALPDGAAARYMYGEQDFLNEWFPASRRGVLDYRYHCLAEDLGTPGRDPVIDAALQLEQRSAEQRSAALNQAAPETRAEQQAGLAAGLVAGSPNSTMEATCKVVEYASCDIWGETGVRWKPWMHPNLLANGKLVCRFAPTKAFWRVYRTWLEVHEDGLAYSREKCRSQSR